MDLLPQELREHIPKLYCTRREADPKIWVKFFSPFFNWRWYIVECEEVDRLTMFYGWMVSSVEKHGRFIRTDLTSMHAYFGITIERDPHFTPCRLSHIQQEKGES